VKEKKQMRLSCFGSLNCPENYKCPLFEQCGKALLDETMAMPLEVWHIVQRRIVENKTCISWEARAKK
jgi:hypothetical protein